MSRIAFTTSSDSFARLSDLANALRTAHRSGELKQPPRLFVLVDEYDRYSNKLMLENTAQYLASLKDKNSVASLVHPLRSLFETLKSIGGHLNRYRTLVVGLTPVAIADASGANVWKNISSVPAFSDLCGFTEADLKRALSEIGLEDDKQQVPLTVMKKFFNGYKFPASRESLYNPQLSLDFLSKLQRGQLSMDRLKQVVDKMEKKLEVDARGAGLVDPRSKASENVLALLAQSPALQIYDSLVSSEAIKDSNTNKLTSYNLCDPIVSTDID